MKSEKGQMCLHCWLEDGGSHEQEREGVSIGDSWLTTSKGKGLHPTAAWNCILVTTCRSLEVHFR